MHTCPECGKKMATAGGLEIHAQIAHTARADAAAYEPGAVAAEPASPGRVPRSQRDPRALVSVERPRAQSKLAAVPLIALAVVALLVAGIATAVMRRNPSPLAMVKASATTTADAKTAHVATTIKTDSGPLANGVTVDGGFDFASRRASLQMTGAQFGAPELGKIQTIVDYDADLTVYIKIPADAADQFDGKQWLKFDVGALMRQAGMDVDIGSLLQGQSNDPTRGLGMLRGADDVNNLGHDKVRDVDTTHYSLTVNLDKAIADASTPEQRDAMQKLSNLYTVRRIPVELWLDSEGRVRRFQESLDTGTIRLPEGLRTKGNPLTGHVTVTYELYDFGRPVDVNLPPASQTADLNQLLKQAGN